MMLKDFFPDQWCDDDFKIDQHQNIVLPDENRIYKHGIGTTSAVMHVHFRPAYCHVIIYKSSEMKNFLGHYDQFPNSKAVYTPSKKSRGMPTARGFLVNVDDFVGKYWHKFVVVSQKVVDEIKHKNRRYAGLYTERIIWPSICHEYNKTWYRAKRDEDVKYGIDGYTDGVTTQIKLDTPDTPNIFIQTHTNNRGWWNKKQRVQDGSEWTAAKAIAAGDDFVADYVMGKI